MHCSRSQAWEDMLWGVGVGVGCGVQWGWVVAMRFGVRVSVGGLRGGVVGLLGGCRRVGGCSGCEA